MAKQPLQPSSERDLNEIYDEKIRMQIRDILKEELSDNNLRMRIQDIFVNSLIFKVAIGVAVLGALLIGVVSFSSSFISFNIHDAVTRAQADLQNTKDDLERTENKYKQTKVQLDDFARNAKQNIDSIVKEAIQADNDEVKLAANQARDSIPTLVSVIVTAQKDDLEKALSEEEEKIIKEFHNTAEEVEKKHEKALSANLNETIPQSFTNIIFTWIDSWPWWLRWTLYVVVPVIIIGIIIAFFARLRRR